MKRDHNLDRFVTPWPALVCSALLVACGGGGGGTRTAADAAPTSQFAAGTVTGFGSVYVDGVRMDDAQAAVQSEDADGAATNTALQLGHRVRVTHDGSGRATRVLVDAAVIGRVSAIDSAGGRFTAAGQSVVVNGDPSIGPVTAFGGGYTSFSALSVSDIVEVHGSPVFIGGQWSVRATRVEKRIDNPGLRVAGVAGSVVKAAGVQRFQLGGLTVDFSQALAAGRVTPSVEQLADGAAVRVFASSTSLSGATLVASAVRIGGERDGVAAATTVQLGGPVSSFDSTAGSFRLEGALVRFSAAQVSPDRALLGPGSWVKVTGVIAADGSVDAARIEVRQGNIESDAARVKLIGPISDLNNVNSFIVRELAVDASGVTSRPGCPATLVDGLVVDVTAQLQANSDVLLASSLSCLSGSADSKAVRPAGGRIVAIDAGARVLTVSSREAAMQQIAWTDATAFVGRGLAGSSSLAVGMDVRAEGIIEAGVFTARSISLLGARSVDRFRKALPPGVATEASEVSVRWEEYFNRPRP